MKAKRDDRLTVPEAASALGISTSTAWRMVRRRELPTVRIGRRRWVGRERIEEMLAPARRMGVPFTMNHGIWKLVGRYRSRKLPGLGAVDKHAILGHLA